MDKPMIKLLQSMAILLILTSLFAVNAKAEFFSTGGPCRGSCSPCHTDSSNDPGTGYGSLNPQAPDSWTEVSNIYIPSGDFQSHYVFLFDTSGDGVHGLGLVGDGVFYYINLDSIEYPNIAVLTDSTTYHTYNNIYSYDSALAIYLGDAPASVPNQTEGNAPNTFILGQNYPNPFTTTSSIRFSITDPNLIGKSVKLSLVDIKGKEMGNLYYGIANNGEKIINVDAAKLSPGNYFYKLECGTYSLVRSLTISK